MQLGGHAVARVELCGSIGRCSVALEPQPVLPESSYAGCHRLLNSNDQGLDLLQQVVSPFQLKSLSTVIPIHCPYSHRALPGHRSRKSLTCWASCSLPNVKLLLVLVVSSWRSRPCVLFTGYPCFIFAGLVSPSYRVSLSSAHWNGIHTLPRYQLSLEAANRVEVNVANEP